MRLVSDSRIRFEIERRRRSRKRTEHVFAQGRVHSALLTRLAPVTLSFDNVSDRVDHPKASGPGFRSRRLGSDNTPKKAIIVYACLAPRAVVCVASGSRPPLSDWSRVPFNTGASIRINE